MSEKNFICGGGKYVLDGVKGTSNFDTIGMPVVLAGLPPTLEVEGYTLQLRSGFHVTLVAMGEMERKGKVALPGFVEKVVADFCAFVQENPVEFVRFRNEFRFATSGERRSVIAMCDVSNIEKFFAQLNSTYGPALECPPTHVTLYTLQPNTGIFLTDSEDLTQLTKVIPVLVELQSWHQ